jgi:Rod binding domain-containing protein
MEAHGLSPQSTSEAAHPKDPRLEHCAHEFEASLMAELLKPLQAEDGLTGQDSDSGGGSGGALSGFASESLARAISERGGFGIADRILHQLEPSGAGGASNAMEGKLQSGLKLSGAQPI